MGMAALEEKDKSRCCKESVNRFNIGDQVEVSSDDEGFRGAWYVATILKTLASPRTRLPKGKAQAFVQYQSLLSDSDPNKPLTEYIDLSFIRPLPPPPPRDVDQSFEPLDVVDAFHRDGWWKAVVTKVDVFDDNESNFKKYTVIFEDPPEQFQFSSTDLRVHWEWTNGSWVRPEKQTRMEGLRFCKGMAVEVKLDQKNLEDAWFPATVLEEIGFNSFLVECGNSRNDGESSHSKKTVDCFNVRPPPPKLDVTDFNILEAVDVFHESSWKNAFITKILTDGRYSITLNHTKKEMQISQSEIRPHLHLINGVWTNISRKIYFGVQYEEQSGHADSNTNDPEVAISVESSSISTNSTIRKSSRKKISKAKDHMEKNLPCKMSRKNLLEQSTPCSGKSISKRVKTAPKSEDTLLCFSKKLKKENPVEPLSAQSCHAKWKLIKTTNQETRIAGSALTKCSTNDLISNLPTAGSDSPSRGRNIYPSKQDAGMENKVTRSLGKKGKQLNSQVTSQLVAASDREDNTKGDSAEILVEDVEKDADSSVHAENSCKHFDEVINLQRESGDIGQQKEGGQRNIAGDGASETSFKDCATKEAELSTVICREHEDIVPLENHMAKYVNTAAVGESCHVQAPSTCFPGATQFMESQEMPFIKSSSIWENIESLEVFKVLPQKPHFRPLIECKEASREGFAMAHMLTFANLSEKASKLQIDDSRKVFDGYLEALADLEMFGFDVRAVVDRVNELLSIKNKREQLEDKSKNVHIQMTECDHEKTKLVEDIDETDKMICELEEQRAMKVSMKTVKESKIIALQADANVINERIVNTNHEFESLAAAPW